MRLFRIIFLLCLVLQWQAPAHAQVSPRVLIIHSYSSDYVWTKTINKGVEESLRALKIPVETQYMDAMRDPDPEHLRARAKDLLALIEAQKPRVVIAVDDAVQSYLVEPYLKGRDAPQVIFCGVNAPLKIYGFPAANVSGVRERWHFRDGFALLKKIRPALHSVVLLSDDSQSAGYVLEDLYADQKQAGPFALRLKVFKVHTYQQWQRMVQLHQRRADSLALGLYHSLVDEKTGRQVPPNVVSAWNNATIHVPTLGFADYAKEHGQLCGILESGEEQGYLAGSMARQVLERGVRAGELPVRINQKGIVLLNLKTAERLGIVIPFEIIRAAGIVIK
ncbi:ABC transporter substrate-binding protein [Humidesulfovibrio idahonensis]